MNILVVHNLYRSHNIGGEDKVFAAEVAGLQKAGMEDVQVFTLTAHNDCARWYSSLLGLFWRHSSFRRMRRAIRSNRIDVVHVHNLLPLLSISVLAACRKEGVPVVQTLHNYRYWCPKATFFRNGKVCELCRMRVFQYPAIRHKCFRNSYTQSVALTMSNLCARWLGAFRWITAFFVLTPFQQQQVNRCQPKSSVPVLLKPNAVEPSERKSSPIEKRYTVLYVGRFDEEKGVEELAYAVHHTKSSVSYNMVGTGPLHATITNKVAGYPVTMLGILRAEEVRSLMAESRFLIQPSLWYETFGLTIVEAMIEGCPVIGFRIGTRPDFIVDGYNGFLCEPGELGLTVQRAMETTPSEYERLSANARETARQFLPERIYPGQLMLYKKVSDEHKFAMNDELISYGNRFWTKASN